MKRISLVVGLMVFGISLMIWAGWQNHQQRKLALQRAQQSKIEMIPDGKGGGTATESEGEGPKLTGKAAPAFTLMTLDGKKVSLSDYKGKAVLVNFWATWCGPCKVEMPWFEELRKQYASQGFEILGLADDVDAGKEAITKVVTKTGVTYPILLTDGKVQTSYGGLDVLPMSFYVDKTGTVVLQTAGLGSRDEIEANIRKTIASGGASATITVRPAVVMKFTPSAAGGL